MATTRVVHEVTADAALAGLVEGQQTATNLGIKVTIAIVDRGGTTKAYLRMDGASLASTVLAYRKAHTAVSFQSATDELFQRISKEPSLLASMPVQPDMAILGGGVPLRSGDDILGAIGVSGGQMPQDVLVANAVAALLGS